MMRVSYSMLAAFYSGDVDRAVAPFVGAGVEPTKAMVEGKNLHLDWERIGKDTGRLPDIFGGEQFKNPSIEYGNKKARQLNDWLELSGMLDVLDDGTDGVDYKTGVSSAGDYANGWQHKVYQILYPTMKRFHYHAHNQYTKQNTYALCHLTPRTLEDGLEWVISTASDLKAYLENSGIKPERPSNTRRT